MQIRIQVALLAAVMIPGFAHAEQMIRKETIKPEALASMQAVVDYCSSVDARNREYFEGQEQVALLDVRPQAELPRRDALLLRRPRDTVRHRRHESAPARAGARDKGRVRDQKSAN